MGSSCGNARKSKSQSKRGEKESAARGSFHRGESTPSTPKILLSPADSELILEGFLKHSNISDSESKEKINPINGKESPRGIMRKLSTINQIRGATSIKKSDSSITSETEGNTLIGIGGNEILGVISHQMETSTPCFVLEFKTKEGYKQFTRNKRRKEESACRTRYKHLKIETLRPPGFLLAKGSPDSLKSAGNMPSRSKIVGPSVSQFKRNSVPESAAQLGKAGGEYIRYATPNFHAMSSGKPAHLEEEEEEEEEERRNKSKDSIDTDSSMSSNGSNNIHKKSNKKPQVNILPADDLPELAQTTTMTNIHTAGSLGPGEKLEINSSSDMEVKTPVFKAEGMKSLTSIKSENELESPNHCHPPSDKYQSPSTRKEKEIPITITCERGAKEQPITINNNFFFNQNMHSRSAHEGKIAQSGHNNHVGRRVEERVEEEKKGSGNHNIYNNHNNHNNDNIENSTENDIKIVSEKGPKDSLIKIDEVDTSEEQTLMMGGEPDSEAHKIKRRILIRKDTGKNDILKKVKEESKIKVIKSKVGNSNHRHLLYSQGSKSNSGILRSQGDKMSSRRNVMLDLGGLSTEHDRSGDINTPMATTFEKTQNETTQYSMDYDNCDSSLHARDRIRMLDELEGLGVSPIHADYDRRRSNMDFLKGRDSVIGLSNMISKSSYTSSQHHDTGLTSPAMSPNSPGLSPISPPIHDPYPQSSRDIEETDISNELNVTNSVILTKMPDGKKKINQYIILGTIGKGSYGSVKECINSDTRKIVAMKVMNKRKLKRIFVGKNKTAFHQAQTEIAIMKKINHQNVVRLIEVIDDPEHNKLLLIMEYIKNGSVLERIEGKKGKEALAKGEIWRYFRDLIYGVEYCHEKAGIIHRDIKPENLLLDHRKNLKIVDFGVGFIMEDGLDDITTTQGSSYYLAPEVCQGIKHKGRKSDIWACGITLYHMVVGKVPFISKDIPSLYEEIINGQIKYPDFIDAGLLDLLKMMLTKDPQKRISVQEIKNHDWITAKGMFLMKEQKGNKIEIAEEDIKTAFSHISVNIWIAVQLKLNLERARKRIAKRKSLSSENMTP